MLSVEHEFQHHLMIVERHMERFRQLIGGGAFAFCSSVIRTCAIETTLLLEFLYVFLLMSFCCIPMACGHSHDNTRMYVFISLGCVWKTWFGLSLVLSMDFDVSTSLVLWLVLRNPRFPTNRNVFDNRVQLIR